MKRTLLAALALGVALLGGGCGHHHDYPYDYYDVGPGYDEPFSLTLVNDTSFTIVAGPIDAYPYDPYLTGIELPPGASATLPIGFLPSSIVVRAVLLEPPGAVPYPTTTLVLGYDYFAGSTGISFVFR